MTKLRKTVEKIIENSSVLKGKKPRYICKTGEFAVLHHDGNIIRISSCSRICHFLIVDTELGIPDELDKAYLSRFTEDMKWLYGEDEQVPTTDPELFDYFYKYHLYHVNNVKKDYIRQEG